MLQETNTILSPAGLSRPSLEIANLLNLLYTYIVKNKINNNYLALINNFKKFESSDFEYLNNNKI